MWGCVLAILSALHFLPGREECLANQSCDPCPRGSYRPPHSAVHSINSLSLPLSSCGHPAGSLGITDKHKGHLSRPEDASFICFPPHTKCHLFQIPVAGLTKTCRAETELKSQLLHSRPCTVTVRYEHITPTGSCAHTPPPAPAGTRAWEV